MKDYSRVLLLVLGLFLLSGLIYIWQDSNDYTTLKKESTKYHSLEKGAYEYERNL